MHLHGSAALTVRQRRRLCDLVAAGATVTAAALVVGCSRQTASKWSNWDRRGEPLGDRSSRPRRSPRRTPAAVEEAILQAREQLREGPHVIGWALGIAASTVHAVLRRHGCSRLAQREPATEALRYEYTTPGGLIHVDIKKLGRILQPGHRVTGDRSKRLRRNAGWQHSGSRSTTVPDSATQPSTQTRPPPAQQRSSTSSFTSTTRMGSPSNAS
jgi:hypothetical protein